ncbi:MAG TPA: hypothetical protein VNA16_05265, partial [Abditibacteriaceae bacterium]|nr:hypothetical protein [Abditibacteriaceae bacterium]
NELFFLLFSDYTKINNRKPQKWDNFMALLERYDDFVSLKSQLLSTLIPNKRHADFVASLQQSAEPIEKVRNCVAHNRSLSNKLAQNYQQSYATLLRSIEDFLSGEAISDDVENTVIEDSSGEIDEV